MRTTLVLIAAACIGFLVSAAPLSDAPALETRVSIRPVTSDQYQLLRRSRPGMYRCSLIIRDVPAGAESWGTPDLVLGPGEKGEEVRSRGSLRATFAASISKSADHADATVTVTRDGKVMFRQVSSVSLPKDRSAAKPLR